MCKRWFERKKPGKACKGVQVTGEKRREEMITEEEAREEPEGRPARCAGDWGGGKAGGRWGTQPAQLLHYLPGSCFASFMMPWFTS